MLVLSKSKGLNPEVTVLFKSKVVGTIQMSFERKQASPLNIYEALAKRVKGYGDGIKDTVLAELASLQGMLKDQFKLVVLGDL